MRIGFVTDLSEDDFRFASQLGVSVLEYLEEREDVGAFTARTGEVQELCRRYRIELGVLGRFGRNTISDDASEASREITDTKELMSAAGDLGVKVFVTGAGPAEQREHRENCRRAADVLGDLVEHGQSVGVKVALHTCHRGNFAFGPPSWQRLLSDVPELGIKFDPAHPYYDGCDWREQMRDWGSRFYHVHAKGVLRIGGERLEDPNPGFDDLPWGTFFALLYHHDYDGDVMIEPHSGTWGGARRYAGLRYSVNYLRQFVL